MKKIIIAIILAVMLMASNAYAAGSCAETIADYPGSFVIVKLACTGDAANGSIPNTAISTAAITLLTGKYYLYTVSAYPTSGGTAPDAADVFILDGSGEDLLGSADGGTTANKGANLIHATLKKTTYPYSYHSSAFWYPAIVSGLTLKVSNQATNSANYTIELVFVR
jgi:hypothetical protein